MAKSKRPTIRNLFKFGLQPHSFDRRFTLRDVWQKHSHDETKVPESDENFVDASEEPTSPTARESTGDTTVSLVQVLQSRDLIFHLISATGIRVADAGGTSDPYVHVRLGPHVATSRVIEKNLNPEWNEMFVFRIEDVQESIADGKPYIEIRLFDRDLMSADDFLGQCKVPLSSLDPAHGTNGPISIPLTYKKKSLEIEHGSVTIAAWFSKSAGATGSAPCLSLPVTMTGPVLTPRVVHGTGGSGVIYEAPVMCVVAVMVEKLIAAGDDDEEGGATSPRSGKKRSILPWRRNSDNSRTPELKLARVTSAKSDAGLDGIVLADYDPYGEDFGDMWDGLDDDIQDTMTASETKKAKRAAEKKAREESHLLSQVSNDFSDDFNEPSELLRADSTDDAEVSSRVPLIYCKLTVGTQVRVSSIVRERPDGGALWNKRYLFCIPIPMRDRELQIELYRTSSARRKGRLFAATKVSLFDVLPREFMGPEAIGPAAIKPPVRRTTMPLTSAISKTTGQAYWGGGHLAIGTTVAALDTRRELHGQHFIQKAADEQPHTRQNAQLLSLQSTTRQSLDMVVEDGENGLMKIVQVGGVYEKTVTVVKSVGSLVPIPSMETLTSLPSYLLWPLQSAPEGGEESVEQAPALPEPEDDSSKPAPLARVAMTIERLNIEWPGSTPTNTNIVAVVNSGPYWARSGLKPSNEIDSMDWHISLPLHDPSTVLLLGIFHVSSARATPVFLGKLRVRLSCLKWNTPITADLPLLSDRRKGAQNIGSAMVTFQVNYRGSKEALMDGYLGSMYPKQVYMLGLDESAPQKLINAETQRITLRWLDGASPPIPQSVALALLDTHRDTFDISRFKVNWRRVKLAWQTLGKPGKFYGKVKSWDRPVFSCVSIAIHWAFIYMPNLVLPALLVWACWVCYKAKSAALGIPYGMEHDPEDMDDEEDIELEVATTNPYVVLKRKYDRILSIMMKLANIVDDIAITLEKMVSAFSWEDATSTALFVGLLLVSAGAIFVIGLQFLLCFGTFWALRPPRMRTPWPPPPVNLFHRLPRRGDRIA